MLGHVDRETEGTNATVGDDQRQRHGIVAGAQRRGQGQRLGDAMFAREPPAGIGVGDGVTDFRVPPNQSESR